MFGDRFLPKGVLQIKRVLTVIAVLALIAAAAYGEIVGRVAVKAEDGSLQNIGERSDLTLEMAKLAARIRQDDAGNCYGPVYLFIKGQGANKTQAKLQMRMKPLNCTITENGIELDNIATVDYRITQQGYRGITGISQNGYFEYGVLGNKEPVKHKGEERVLISIENGKAQITGQSFGIRDMVVTDFDN